MKNLLLLILCFSMMLHVNAQVGIGTNTPNASAALEIQDTTRGILIPRMTSIQRNAIVNPAEGLMVYQTDSTKGYWFYNGLQWKFNGIADGTTAGEMLYWDGNEWLTVPPGSYGQAMLFCNGVPTWGSCPAEIMIYGNILLSQSTGTTTLSSFIPVGTTGTGVYGSGITLYVTSSDAITITNFGFSENGMGASTVSSGVNSTGSFQGKNATVGNLSIPVQAGVPRRISVNISYLGIGSQGIVSGDTVAIKLVSVNGIALQNLTVAPTMKLVNSKPTFSWVPEFTDTISVDPGAPPFLLFSDTVYVDSHGAIVIDTLYRKISISNILLQNNLIVKANGITIPNATNSLLSDSNISIATGGYLAPAGSKIAFSVYGQLVAGQSANFPSLVSTSGSTGIKWRDVGSDGQPIANEYGYPTDDIFTVGVESSYNTNIHFLFP